MSQLTLLEVPAPEIPSEIDLRCCSVQQLIDEYDGPKPSLIIADPPWCYQQAPGHSANPENHYNTLTELEIAQMLNQAYELMDKGRLALWITWPFIDLWYTAKSKVDWRWRYVSGGCWVKEGGHAGTGYHWLGKSEPVMLYVKSTGLCSKWTALPNAYTSGRQAHSEKPMDWMVRWIERWTNEGDTVMDLFAGMAPVASACLKTNRKYVGAEIDPVRHRQAVDRIALRR